MALAKSSSKEVIKSCLKKIQINKRMTAPTPIVINISVSWTARILPKRIWKRSVELLATLIKMIPRAKKEEKVNADGGIAFDNRVSLDVGNDDSS